LGNFALGDDDEEEWLSGLKRSRLRGENLADEEMNSSGNEMHRETFPYGELNLASSPYARHLEPQFVEALSCSLHRTAMAESRGCSVALESGE
jgi:hypothetical protein